MCDETRSFGLFGGKSGSLPIMRLLSRDGRERKLEVNSVYQVSEGDIFEIVSQGGGGFGDPFERPSEQVRDDVRNGFVSVEKARQEYGIVLEKKSGELEVNSEATLRKKAERGS
jgi:N-methylhydantoinase B